MANLVSFVVLFAVVVMLGITEGKLTFGKSELCVRHNDQCEESSDCCRGCCRDGTCMAGTVTQAQQEEGDGRASFFLRLFQLSPPYKDCIAAPLVCPNKDITFHLYTSETENSPQVLDVADPDSLQKTKFLEGRPVKFLLHGYNGNKDDQPNSSIRPAYLKNMDVNVISIDYGALVRDPCYVWAVHNVPLVANCTAQLIDALVSLGKVSLDDFHLLGFSLGAQVAGVTANYLKSGKLTRITGLDPALPLFVVPQSNRLDAKDAIFVDVIHTNAGQRGKVEASGQVDFYVNDGTSQPGCDMQDLNEASSCSHERAPIIFAESITSKEGFWGFPCPSYKAFFDGHCWRRKTQRMKVMGEFANPRANGIYFVETNKKPPYAAGKTSGKYP